jgi:quercetin dioxygenase-like cupin family protein
METVTSTIEGAGWAAGSIDGMGEGPGFRKVRRELGVTAFGANAVVIPPGYTTPRHRHERQEELYLVVRGTIEFQLGDDERALLGPGGLVRVSPDTVRCLRNTDDSAEAVYFCVGGADGYVGRDGVSVES